MVWTYAIISFTFTVVVTAHCPRGGAWDKMNSRNTIPRFPVDSQLSTMFPLGSWVWQKNVTPAFPPPPHNTQPQICSAPPPIVQTYLYGDVHPAFVWVVMRLNGHNSDFDGVARLVAWSVSLDEGGDVPEGEGGGVGENEIGPLVAAHPQV